jgi:type VI secretion system secreted protein VgrG
MAYPQANTILAITTPFGADAVLCVRFFGEERISGLFRFDLEMISPERSLDFDTIVGQGVTVKVKRADGKVRHFHGIVTRFLQAGRAGKQTSYRAEIHPKLWLLTKTRDSRIYQNKSVPDIVKAVLSEHGVTDVKDQLTGSYDPRDYCVQHQESAFNFVSRLLEDEGIYYYFEHTDGKHTLVLADDSANSPPCEDLAAVRYIGDSEATALPDDAVIECTLEQRVVVGRYAATDYNFEMPDTSLLVDADGKAGKPEVFEYPGGHKEKGPGESRAKVRIEAEEALKKRLSGRSVCRAFCPGHTFKMKEHERDDVNDDYVVRQVVHSATGQTYTNTFEGFPKSIPFRPPRLTPKPVVYGAQTAVVVGKSGEEIWTDEFGRIKVQFFWDRKGKKDDKSSCFIRVAQGWAGKGWGAFFLPRVGQEVIVSFLDGDPDRPLVTGSVYNASQTVPYALPDNQTKSTVLSRSSKEGSAGNEIRFEDKKDSEEIYVHAQKDMVFEVENDWTITVKHDESRTVKNDRKAKIEEGNDSLEVTKGNRTIDVKKGNETHNVKGKRTLEIVDNEAHTNKGNFDHKVKGNYTLKIDGDLVIEAKNITIKAQQAVTMKAGMDFKTEAGMNMVHKAGMDLKLDGGMNVDAKGGVAFKAKGGAMASVEGGGMLTLKGGLVKIN